MTFHNAAVRPSFLLILVVSVFWGGQKSALSQEDPFAAGVRPTDPLTPEEEQQALQVPPGFRIRLFAAEPQIQKPMNMAFDARGRLWVSGSNDYPFPNLENPGDSIRILEDTDGDGRADKVTVFVDNIAIPIGLYPYKDGVIAYSIPNTIFYRDTDGDGKADQQQVLLGPFDFSKDTHGMQNAFRRGFDGWIYANHGFNNVSTVTSPDGNTITMNSGNTYRFRTDGSRIEHFTWGQVNPFGMTFDPQGDLFNSDCHTKPIMLLIRDAHYPGFGRQHDGLGFMAGVMDHAHGSTAIAGVMQYTGKQYPEAYRQSLFVGNVMTSRVHRDTIHYTGSSIRVHEEPDFVISKDPWFRPVDLQCGPDGALYVADFYNKIIGHYEVPLLHPGRDRYRGRIWRIEYVGDNPDAPPTPGPEDISQAPVARLIEIMGDENLPARIRAMGEATDRIGAAAAPELESALKTELSPLARTSVLWTLQQLDALADAQVLTAMQADEELVRIHGMRILGDRKAWTDALRKGAIAGLQDPAPLVRRAVADAFGRHPHADHFVPLFAAYKAAPDDDVHLKQTLKIALRNQLRVDENLKQLDQLTLSPADEGLIAGILVGVNSTAAADTLLGMVGRVPMGTALLTDAVKMAARHASPENISRVIEIARDEFKSDPELQVALQGSIYQGIRQRGAQVPDSLTDWVLEMTGTLLESRLKSLQGWEVVEVSEGKEAPWDVQMLMSENTKGRQPFLSSRPGGENVTSTIRSETFEIPKQLTFYVSGHQGHPAPEGEEQNIVRLCLADSGKEVARASAPRRDQAKRIEWNLGEVAGKQGYLEIVDNIAQPAYAWIGAGRFDPPVVKAPELGPITAGKRIQSAATLIADFSMKARRNDLAEIIRDDRVPVAIRVDVAKAIARLDQSAISAGLAALSGSSASDQATRTIAAELLLAEIPETERDEKFRQIMKGLTTRLQGEAALMMVQTGKQGAEAVMGYLESGIMSPRLLQNAFIKNLVSYHGGPQIAEKVQIMADQLPSTTAERDQLIQQIRSQYHGGTPSATRGLAVFEKNCAACHQIKGKGKIIGPQLDGIGSRGVERLLEDIVDPNRNVDVAFRSTTYALADGKVQTGVFRRKDGELIVIADNKGDEVSFLESDIDDQKVSSISIMPDNWGETIPPAEMLDLLEFLVQERK